MLFRYEMFLSVHLLMKSQAKKYQVSSMKKREFKIVYGLLITNDTKQTDYTLLSFLQTTHISSSYIIKLHFRTH